MLRHKHNTGATSCRMRSHIGPGHLEAGRQAAERNCRWLQYMGQTQMLCSCNPSPNSRPLHLQRMHPISQP